MAKLHLSDMLTLSNGVSDRTVKLSGLSFTLLWSFLAEAEETFFWHELTTEEKDFAQNAIDIVRFELLTLDDGLPIGTMLPSFTGMPNPGKWHVCDGAIFQADFDINTDDPTQWEYYPFWDIMPEGYRTVVEDGDVLTLYVTVPDFRWRYPIMLDQDHESIYGLGWGDGQETVEITEEFMPPHTHTETIAVPTIINGGLEAPASSAVASEGVTGVTGQGQPINIMNPFRTIAAYYIKVKP